MMPFWVENKQYYQLLYLLNTICTFSGIKPSYMDTFQFSLSHHQAVYLNIERWYFTTVINIHSTHTQTHTQIMAWECGCTSHTLLYLVKTVGLKAVFRHKIVRSVRCAKYAHRFLICKCWTINERWKVII
jgi:hypothetical protein